MKISEVDAATGGLMLVMVAMGIVWTPYIVMDAWVWFAIPHLVAAEPLSWWDAFFVGVVLNTFVSNGVHDMKVSALVWLWVRSVPGLHLLLWWLS